MLNTNIFFLSVFATCIQSLNNIVISGSKFFDEKTGDQFFIKGVAYQPRDGGSKFEDPLAKPKECQRDAKLMQELNLNVIRVYEVDPSNNHDECMKTFNDAGIYLMLDLAIPDYSIVRSDPKYNLDILEHYKQNVDAFSKYDNTLAFFAGNEVNNDKSNTNANPFVKAVMRDIKAYIKATSKRYIPVGYANNDDPDTRLNIQKYFNCGSDEERADFFGINIYSWCGKSTFQKSGMKDRVEEFKDYSIPSLLSEYGCNKPSPRNFEMVKSLYGDDMKDVFSGGIVYEFSQEDNNYGLVEIKNGEVKKLKDFNNLKDQMKNVDPKGIKKDQYKSSLKNDDCPSNDKNWEASEKLPSTPSKGACDCMISSLKCSVSKDFNITKESEKVGKMFEYLCADVDCSIFSQDGKKGEYGVWSACKPIQQLSWATNQKFVRSGEQSDACSSNSQLVTPSKKEDQCKDIKADIKKDGSGSKNSKGSSSTISHNPSAYILAITVIASLNLML